jgi:uncharacterized membrane protein
MQVDRMGAKSNLLLVAFLLAGVSLMAYLLLKNIHKIDPKRVGDRSSASFGRLALGIAVFISVLNLLIIVTSSSGDRHSIKLIQPLLGLLFAFIGNYLPALKPNYFAGIRLPWTLSSETNWRQTHQLAGKLWFWGGLALAVASMFIPSGTWMILFIIAMVILVLVPCVYSYRLFAKEKATQS